MVSPPPPQWLANLEFLTSGLTSHSLLKSSPMLATLARILVDGGDVEHRQQVQVADAALGQGFSGG